MVNAQEIKTMLLHALRYSDHKDVKSSSKTQFIYLLKNSELFSNESKVRGTNPIEYTLTVDFDLIFKCSTEDIESFEKVLNFLLYKIEPRGTIKVKSKKQVVVDWTGVYPKYSKEAIIDLLEREKNLFVSVSTGTTINESLEQEFIDIKEELHPLLLKMELDVPMSYGSLIEWVRNHDNLKLQTYKSRREFINEQYINVVNAIRSTNYPNTHFLNYSPTGWEKIDDEVVKLNSLLNSIDSQTDNNAFAVRARELFIDLASIVYDEKIHVDKDDDKKYTLDRSKNILNKFIEERFKGPQNKELRQLIKASVDYTSKIVHAKGVVDSSSARIIYTSVLSVIDYIAIVKIKI